MANKAVAKAKARAKKAKKPPLVVPLANKTGKISFRFDGKNEKAQKVVKAVGAKLVTFVTNETMAAIRTVIVKAIREGIPPYDAAKSIVGVVSKPGATTNEMPGMIGLNNPQILAAFNYKAGLIDIGHNPDTVDRLMAKYVTRKLRERSVMIARSETMLALNTGAEMGYIQAAKQGALPPEARMEWITTPDERACLRPNGGCVGMNGKTKPIGGVFSDGSTGPPRHPHCLPGDSLVLAVGLVSATSERWYEGDLVVIRTARAKKLRITANHPILCKRGWVRAGMLDEGDHLVGHVIRDSATISAAPSDENVEYRPAPIQQVVEAFHLSGSTDRFETPVSTEDFHGDGGGSEVAIIRTNGKLPDSGDTPALQRLDHGDLVGSGETAPALSRSGTAQPFIHTASLSSGGRARHPGHRLEPSDRHETAGLRTTPHQPGGLHALVDETGAASALASDLVSGKPGEIEWDQVLSVHTEHYNGYVYNLETTVGWYWADGVAVSNCRCTTGIVMAPPEGEE